MSASNEPTEVNAKRILDAADLLLLMAAKHGGVLRMDELRTPHRHEVLTDLYTPEELAAALCFLVRLGLAEHQSSAEMRP